MNTRPSNILTRQQRHATRRGVALILTLSAVLLLSVLILAFFSKAQLNRQISSSSSSLGKANNIARCALDLIVGELRDEIIDSAHSTLNTVSGVPLYLPIKTDDLIPRPSGVASASGVLLKVSADNTPIRTSGTLVGSNISTGTASLNGRSLSAARWYTMPVSSPQLGSQPTLPTWIFITRGNGTTTPTLANAKDTTSPDYVIGRFAFALYNTGSLPDANIAGYRTTAPYTIPASDIGTKSSTAYADLTALGFTNASIDRFVAWRNPATSTDPLTYLEWSSGIPRPATSGTANPAAMAAARSGHRSIAFGDNALLSRHDLLNQTTLSAAISPLTHFSRSLNSPSSCPAASYLTVTNSNLATVRYTGAANSYLHYRDDGTTETLPIKAGDLLLQHRFSLAKLAWLTSKGPSASLPTTDPYYNAGGTPAAILSCFGLKWNGSLAIGNSTTPCWQYVDNNGTVTDKIKTLNVVAGEGREPNFFELLKAGILNDSLGKASANKTFAMSNQKLLEAAPDLQILRIGANIIDCADPDNYPTTLTLKTTNSVGTLDIPVYGVEDLPYLYSLMRGRMTEGTAVTTDSTTVTAPLTTTNSIAVITVSKCSLVMTPVLFNPHAASTPTMGTPGNIRVEIVSGQIDKAYVETYKKFNPDPLTETPGRNLSTGTTSSFSIPNSSFETFRNSTSPHFDASSNNRIANLSAANVDVKEQNMNGFLLHTFITVPKTFSYSYTTTKSASGGGSDRPYYAITTSVSKLLIALKYQAPDGSYHTYDTMAGNEAYTALSNGTGLGYDGGPTNQFISFGPTFNAATAWNYHIYNFTKIDPRTTRFSGATGGNSFLAIVPAPILTATNTSGISQAAPFGSGTPATPGVFPGVWAEGGTTDWVDGSGDKISNVSDNPDTSGTRHVRPADAWLYGDKANLFRDLADNTRRPVILQRPFRSVGELGYVFRDSPWKTLNFFDSSSADSALLDLFSVADEPTVTAGRIHLNNPRITTHQALLTGTAQDTNGTSPLSSPLAIAQAFSTYAFTSTASTAAPTSNMPMDLSKLAQFMATASLPIGGSTGLDSIKYRREAVIRSLANNTQTRTWNLLIDVVAQTGRYPANATSLNNFIVEGEKRYWLSIAIDRYTGKIIDRQLEPANE